MNVGQRWCDGCVMCMSTAMTITRGRVDRRHVGVIGDLEGRVGHEPGWGHAVLQGRREIRSTHEAKTVSGSFATFGRSSRSYLFSTSSSVMSISLQAQPAKASSSPLSSPHSVSMPPLSSLLSSPPATAKGSVQMELTST